MREVETLIIGGGLAGLACALTLQQAGREAVIVEADSTPGGRVRTDHVGGFTIDRGFQVLLTAYPEAQRWLDLEALDLRRFVPGARIHTASGWQQLGDPLRRPGDLWPTLRADVGTLADKARILRWRLRVAGLGHGAGRPDELLVDALPGSLGFSRVMISRFLAPFLGGVFLDPELRVSRRMADFVWQMFSSGHATVPARGMQAIPEQLAARLQPGSLVTGVRALALHELGVDCSDGLRPARHTVIATTMREAARLLDEPSIDRSSQRCTHWSFAAPTSPVGEAVLCLDGERAGPVNNLHAVTDLVPEASPDGRALISATELGDSANEGAVRAQLTGWFGGEVESWELLQRRTIAEALPRQRPEDLRPWERPPRRGDRLWLCGDHRTQSSIEGALRSGRLTAEALLQEPRR